jgi:hypothetical protein
MGKNPQIKDSIEERLRAEKPGYSAPAGFTDRVMAKLSAQERVLSAEKDAASSWNGLWVRFAFGLAILAIAAVFAVEFFEKPETQLASQESHPAPASNSEQEGNAEFPGGVTLPLPRITQEQFQALATRVDEPLEKELQHVISDTRLAIQFVASNFLPEQ